MESSAESVEPEKNAAAMQKARVLSRKKDESRSLKLISTTEQFAHSHANDCLKAGLLVGGLTIAGALYRKNRSSHKQNRLRKASDAANAAPKALRRGKHVTFKEDVCCATSPQNQ